MGAACCLAAALPFAEPAAAAPALLALCGLVARARRYVLGEYGPAAELALAAAVRGLGSRPQLLVEAITALAMTGSLPAANEVRKALLAVATECLDGTPECEPSQAAT